MRLKTAGVKIHYLEACASRQTVLVMLFNSNYETVIILHYSCVIILFYHF